MQDNHPAVDHIILYAKGHYVRSYSVTLDLVKMFENLEQPSDWKSIITVVCQVALTAIRKAEPTHRIPPPRSEKKPEGMKALQDAVKSVSPLTEFTEMITSAFDCSDDMLLKHGPKETDFQEDVIEKTQKAIQEILLNSLLVPIARWNVSELDLVDPYDRILPVADPKKYDKKKRGKDETY